MVSEQIIEDREIDPHLSHVLDPADKTIGLRHLSGLQWIDAGEAAHREVLADGDLQGPGKGRDAVQAGEIDQVQPVIWQLIGHHQIQIAYRCCGR